MTISRTLHLTAGSLALGVVAFGGVTASAQDLVVYTPQAPDRMAVLEERAEEALGFEIEFLTMGGGEVYDRLLAERNNPQADVVYGLIDFLMAGLKAEGMLMPYEPEFADGLPARFIDPDGYFYGYRQTPITLSYNTDLIAADDAPTSWLELAEPGYEGSFMIGSLRWQTTRAILAGLFSRFMDENGEISDEGWDWFERFYANAIVFEEGMNRPQMIASGETPFSLNHFLGVQRDAADGGYNYAYIDTDGGTPVVVERNGIVAGTDDFDRALAFLEFASSVDWQVENAELFGVIPVHPDAIARAPEEVRYNATLLTAQPIDWDLIAANLDGWLERIQLELL